MASFQSIGQLNFEHRNSVCAALQPRFFQGQIGLPLYKTRGYQGFSQGQAGFVSGTNLTNLGSSPAQADQKTLCLCAFSLSEPRPSDLLAISGLHILKHTCPEAVGPQSTPLEGHDPRTHSQRLSEKFCFSEGFSEDSAGSLRILPGLCRILRGIHTIFRPIATSWLVS